MLARVMALPMATFCVCTGHAYAGGLILALAHDFRIMRADFGNMCLSEMNIGFVLPSFYLKICQETL